MTEPTKKIIFFPSYSVGVSGTMATENYRINDKTTARIYSRKDTTEKMYHPYYLITAGHHYKNMNFREKFALTKEVFVMGDSGGFQIATGALKWDLNLREKIFLWLEANSDIAMNIDLPPRREYQNNFNEALEKSIDNFKYFSEHQTGKTQFLNVLQGSALSFEHATQWYEKAKDFEFSGWAMGGSRTVDKIMMGIAMFLQYGEFNKSYNKYLHYLGVSAPEHFFILTMLQKALNKRFDNRIQVTCDSSTPSLTSAYGSYYYGVNWNVPSFKLFTISKKDKLNLSTPLPCSLDCDVCSGLTYGDIADFDKHQYSILIYHNTNIFLDTMRKINVILDSHDELIKEFLTTPFYNLYKTINEMFESDKPLSVYNKHINLFRSFSGTDELSFDKSTVNQFFDFK